MMKINRRCFLLSSVGIGVVGLTVKMSPHYGVVYDRRELKVLRIIDPGVDPDPTRVGYAISAANPVYETLIDGTHVLDDNEAMALLPRLWGLRLDEIADLAMQQVAQ